ncbi:MAG: hypothetical protein GF375_04930 [Candidatus Omnitrophica bacterium]|nr:hypothetical protein [Candidatus Omnitrophota bacterium]
MDINEFIEKFLGPEGEANIKKLREHINATRRITEKSLIALDALTELTTAVENARARMADGYEKTKSLLSPETLKKLVGLYQTVKKWGIFNILENLTKQEGK